MTHSIHIRDSVVSDVKELCKTMRAKDRLEAESLGLNPDKTLFYSYRYSILRKTAFVDNKIAAMWGVHGTPLSFLGHPYLVTGQAVEEISIPSFLRIYRDEVKVMSSIFPILENYVDASYEGAVRMLKLAGFTIDNPEPFGPSGQEFSKFSLVTK